MKGKRKMAEVDFNINCWYSSGCSEKTERCKKTSPLYLEMNYMINQTYTQV